MLTEAYQTPTPESLDAALSRLAKSLRHHELCQGEVRLPEEYSLGHVVCLQSYGLRNVCLDHPMLVLVVEGCKRYGLEDNGPLHSLHAPGLLLLPADTPMRIENVPDVDAGHYHALCLSLSPVLLDSVAPHWSPAPSPVFSADPMHPLAPQPLRRDPELLMVLQVLLHNTLQQWQGAPLCPRLLTLQCEQLALLLAMRGMDRHLFTRRDSLVSSAMLLISRQPHLPWTVDSLADQLHCSGRTLRRRMHQEGRSLRELLRHARLHSALGMLQQKRCSVSEAAFSCGYDSPSRFSQRFREHFGLLPSELLRSGVAREGGEQTTQ